MDRANAIAPSGLLSSRGPRLKTEPRNVSKAIDRHEQRLHALKTERSSWDAHWRELSDYLLPRRSRFNATDRNRGTKLNEKIINNTPVLALRVLGAGMVAGITSPARPWFRLGTPDPKLSEFAPVRSWLHRVEEGIREIFAKSNVYNALPSLYQDLGAFGTSPAIIDEDPEDVIRLYTVPIGSYAIANSSRMQVDTLYRELSMTVAQLVERFGLENCSTATRDAYRRGDNLDQWIDVVHVIEPNRERDYSRKDFRGMPFLSCWYEKSRSVDDNRYLREAGYKSFPVVAPRWDLTGEDIYGRSPGMDALGDSKALQLYEKRKAMLVEKLANPPMKAPWSLRNHRTSLLPGDVTFVDSTAGGATYEPAMVVQPAGVTVVDAAIREHESRINQAFYADLWLMMAQSDRRQVTAREIEERHEEKMLQLGPVLERLQVELLDPLIARTYEIGKERNLFPPPPRELVGTDVRVEYISIMAQAQRMLGTVGIERLASFAGSLMGVKPDIVDKLNFDEMVDEYASMLGTKPDLVISDEEVESIRSARAEAAQQAQAAQTSMSVAQGAKTLSETDTEGDNALTRLMGTLGAPVPGVA